MLDDLGSEAVLLGFQLGLGVETHVGIGDVGQGKEGDEVSAPVVEQKLVSGDEEERDGDVVGKAEFAGWNVEKLSTDVTAGGIGLLFAVFARLAKNLFVGDGPGDGRDVDRKDEKPDYLRG